MVLLAVCAAVLWGGGNFLMGVAARGSGPRPTVFVGFAVGTAGAAAFFLIQQPPLTLSSLLYGAGAGMAQGFGWIAFARALTDSSMTLAAPIAATVTVLALLFGAFFQGTSLGPAQLLGAIVAMGAIAMLSTGSGASARQAPKEAKGTAALEAILAGLLFACQAAFLAHAGTQSSSLVLVGAGAGVLVILGFTLVLSPLPRTHFRATLHWAPAGGAAIFVGDVAFLYALARGVPALATAVAQMHPLVTAAIAIIVLREAPRLIQVVGIGLGVIGVLLISSGHA